MRVTVDDVDTVTLHPGNSATVPMCCLFNAVLAWAEGASDSDEQLSMATHHKKASEYKRERPFDKIKVQSMPQSQCVGK